MCDAVSVNKLTVNASKTKYMYFSVSSRSANFPSEPAIELNGQPLDRVEHFKFLGIYFKNEKTLYPGNRFYIMKSKNPPLIHETTN